MLCQDLALHLMKLLQAELAEVELIIGPAQLELLLWFAVDPRDQRIRRPPVALTGAGEEALDDLLRVLLEPVVEEVAEGLPPAGGPA
jgi:hypothetical protein